MAYDWLADAEREPSDNEGFEWVRDPNDGLWYELPQVTRRASSYLIDPEDAVGADSGAPQLIPTSPPQEKSSFFGSLFDIEMADLGKLLGAEGISMVRGASPVSMASFGEPASFGLDPTLLEAQAELASPESRKAIDAELAGQEKALLESRSPGSQAIDQESYARWPEPGEQGSRVTKFLDAMAPSNPLAIGAVALREAFPNTPFIGRDAKLGDFSAAKIAQDVTRSLPSTAAGIAAGGGISSVGRNLAASVLRREAVERAATEGSEQAVRQLARLQRIDRVISGAGYGAGEAVIAAPQAAQDVRDEILELPAELLFESNRFREIYDAARELPEAERIAYARDTLANELGNAAGFRVAAVTFATGPLAADVAARAGRLMEGRTAQEAIAASRGRAKQALVSGAQEAGQEFVQSGGQEFVSAEQVRTVDPTVDSQMRMVEGAIGGMFAGSVMGAGVGALTGGKRPALGREAPAGVQLPQGESPDPVAGPAAQASMADVSRLARAAREAGVDPAALREVSQAVIRKQVAPAEAAEALNSLIEAARQTAAEAATAEQEPPATETPAEPAEPPLPAQGEPDMAATPAALLAEETVKARFKRELLADVPAALERYAALPGTDNGRILAPDMAKRLSPEYVADRTLSDEVAPGASHLMQAAFDQAIQQPAPAGKQNYVVLTSGGTGAGKSTIAADVPEYGEAQVVYDTNLASFEVAKRRIDAARDAGKSVYIVHVYRDPTESFRQGVLPRAMGAEGRPITVESHARTHAQSNEVVRRLAAEYASDAGVTVEIIDNSRGPGKASKIAVEALPAVEYNATRDAAQQQLEEAYDADEISDRIYRASGGQRTARSVVPRVERSGDEISGGRAEPEVRAEVDGFSPGSDRRNPNPDSRRGVRNTPRGVEREAGSAEHGSRADAGPNEASRPLAQDRSAATEVAADAAPAEEPAEEFDSDHVVDRGAYTGAYDHDARVASLRAKLRGDKAFKAAFKSPNGNDNAHVESGPAISFLDGWEDAAAGKPIDEARISRPTADMKPWGFNPVDSYRSGYESQKAGEPRRLRVLDPIETPDKAPAAAAPTEAQPETDVAKIFEKMLLAGAPTRLAEFRRAYGESLGRAVIPRDFKTVDELVERALVTVARRIVDNAKSPAEAFDKLVALYQSQPTLSTRTSTSIENQAYSTPAPLAYLASRLAGITKDTFVLEPSAGNGMLLIEANPKNTHAVELNEERAESLRAQGFAPVVGDALWPSSAPDHEQDVVIANPPFGVVKTDQGDSQTFSIDVGMGQMRTTEIDHAIALTALKHMKVDGRAVLIIGGINRLAKSQEARSDAYNGAAKRKFFFNLQRLYNVVDHFTVSGDLYAKQGAGWPVDIIVIDGRRPSVRALPAVDVPRVYNSWADLKPLLEATNERNDRMGTDTAAAVDAADRGAVRAGADDAALDVPVAARGADTADGGRSAEPAGSGVQPADVAARTGARVGPRPRASERSGEPAGVEQSSGGREARQLGLPAEPAGASSGDAGSAPADGPRSERPARPARAVDERPARDDDEVTTGGQTAYRPSSAVEAIGTLVPSNMRTAIADALTDMSARAGSIDEYVARELGYEPAELGRYFSAEQVDALALALDQMSRGSGFIIGDQTGVGKGRFVAGIIRYALKNGRIPIFVTEKPNLYADIVRDLRDIAHKDIRPLMTNAGERVPIDDSGNELRTQGNSPHNALLNRIAGSADLGEFNIVFTTYNQMQTLKGKPTERMLLLQALAPNAIVIFDESHNAGGSDAERRSRNQKAADGGSPKTGRAAFARALASTAKGVVYSSATYAKRPSVMDLYFKTDMSLAVEGDATKLPAAIALGGVPLQQAVASMLARSGQYIRRERTFEGVEYNTPVVGVDRSAAESISAMMLAVKQFDDAKAGAVDALKRAAKAEAKVVTGSTATGAAGAHSTNFTSVMHNLIDQMLLALKADKAADLALEALKRGEKPVVTVSNTMGSFIEEYADAAGLAGGDAITLTFRDLMLRYLAKSREVQVKDHTGKATRHYLTDEELGAAGLYMYNSARTVIDESPQIQAVPISPIDWIHHRLREAGYSSGEITGRSHTIEYGKNGKATYKLRSSKDTSIRARRNAIDNFNSGKLDALVLNQSGATGLSLHASEKFKDKRRRRMVIAQAEKNIDTHMQMLGRVHRTGQVIAPAYDQLVADVPAEKRPAAVLAKKMASLNANTTASRSSQFTSKETVDFLNIYGDEVAAQLMTDLPEIHLKLGEPLAAGENGLERIDAARKVTGRIPMLPVDEQESLYDLIENAYADRLQQAEAMGENALEAKTLPLDARTVERRVIFDGKQGASPFAAGAVAEVVDVKRLGKPYTSEKVRELVASTLEQPADSTLSALSRAGESARAEVVKDVTAKFEKYLTAEETRMLESDMPEAAREGRVGALRGINARWRELSYTLHVGGSYELTMEDGTTLYGVVTEIRHKKGVKMPVALGSWIAHFAVADGARTLSIPFSRMSTRQAAVAGMGTVTVERASRHPLTGATIEQMFDDGQTLSREQRVVVTGNLLAGYSQMKRGQIVNYTDAGGRTLQGILMPRSFNLAEFTAEAPVTVTADQAIKLLRAEYSSIVRTADGLAQVSRAGGDFAISVPRSKAEGGKYFLDRGLREIVGDFVSTSSAMRVLVPGSLVSGALDYINTQMGQRLEVVTHREAAIRVGGTAIGSRKVEAKPAEPEPLYSRAPVFYSTALATAEALPLRKASGQQWYATLSKRPGVKPDELDWMGLKEWLGDRAGVTKDELIEFMRANEINIEETELGGDQDPRVTAVKRLLAAGYEIDDDYTAVITKNGEDVRDEDMTAAELADWEFVRNDLPNADATGEPLATKYDEYTLPGGKNYRELMLRLPARDTVTQVPSPAPAGWGDTDGGNVGVARRGNIKADFRGGHFDEPNVIAHVRFNERIDADGKRVLFIEEIQSDWHQAGRRRGYRGRQTPRPTLDDVAREVYGRPYSELDEPTRAAVDSEHAARERGTGGAAPATDGGNAVPDAPFKTTWHELALKRMIRYAAESGFDRVAWTTGQTQADRYSLRKRLSAIYYSGSNFSAVDHNGKEVIRRTGVTREELPELIGKAAADRLLAKEPDGTLRSLEGEDLEVGGEGMLTFYDSMLVVAANKYVKKWGAKVGSTTIKADNAPEEVVARTAASDPKHPLVVKNRLPVHSVDVTPAMRDSVLAGQPLFSGARASGGATVAQVRTWLGRAIDKTRGAAETVIVADVDELRRVTGRPNIPDDVEGVYFLGGRTVYLVASRLPDAATAQRKFAHEMFGHLAPERYEDMRRAVTMVQNLRRMKSQSITALWDEVSRLQPGLTDLQHAKEVIALMAERGVKNSIMDRLLAWVRQTLRSWGVNIEHAEAELRALIGRAARALESDARLSARDEASVADADAKDDVSLDAALGAMDLARSPLIESGAPLEQFYERPADVLDGDALDVNLEALDDAIARHWLPQFSRDDGSAFAAEVLVELGAVDELFKRPTTGAGTVREALAAIAPDIEWGGTELPVEESDWFRAERRHVAKLPNGKPLYVYERGREVWIDISDSRRGGGGDAAYQAIADYARNTGRRFIGDPMGLSADAIVRRTYHMLSNMVRYGDLRGFEPAPAQLEGAPDRRIAPLAWPADNAGRFRALIESFYQTHRNLYPWIENVRYNFAERRFVGDSADRLNQAVHHGPSSPESRGIGAPQAGRRTLRAAVFLQSLLRSESSERPAVLAQVLRQPSELVTKGGLDPLFSRSPPEDPQLAADRRKVMAAAGHAALPLRDRLRLFLRKHLDFSKLAARQYIANSFASIEAYERLINAGQLQDASVSPYKQTVATQNLGSVMSAVLSHGVPVWRDGAYVVADDGRKGITDIFAPLVNHPAGNLLPQWEYYAAARRAARLITEGRERLFTQDMIDRALELATTYPEFDGVFNDWQTFNKQALDMAEEAGLLNAESRAIWERNDYVPFYRAVEAASGRLNPVSLKKAIANQRAKIKRLVGGTAALEDVFESMLMNTAHLVDTSFKNRAAQAIVTQFDGVATSRAPKAAQPVRLSTERVRSALEAAGIETLGDAEAEYMTFFRAVAPTDKNVVSVMFDGKPKYFEVHDPLLLESIVQMHPSEFLRRIDVFGLLSGSKRLLTRAVTALPGFIVANLMRDTLSNVVQNENKKIGDMLKLTFLTEAAKGFKDYVTDNRVVHDLMMAGAGGDQIYDNERGTLKKILTRAMQDAEADGFLDTVVSPRRIWNAYRKLQQASENANRIAVYRLVRQRGGSHAEAAYQAHDVLNFQQRGSHPLMQLLVMTVPFLNARVQGLDRLQRGYAANRMGFLLKGLLLTSATLALMAAGDDDERYQELEEWDRDLYWHGWIGDTHIRIPKPFEIGVLFATLPERAVRLMRGQDAFRTTAKSLGRILFDTFAFNPTPQLAKPVIEAWAGKSFFTGAPILSMQDKNVLPEARYRPWTSPTLIELAKAMPDGAPEFLRSPVQLEHLLRGYLGGMAMLGLEVSDTVTRSAGGYPDAPAKAFHEHVLRRFVRVGEPRTTKWHDELYRMLDVADDTARTIKKLGAEGQMEAARRLATERKEQLLVRPRLNDIAQEIRKLSARARMVQSSSMTAEQKRAALEKIYARRNELARMVEPYAPLF
jgi:hypothetical protein